MDGYRLRTPAEGPLNLDDFDLNQDGHFIELKTSRVIDSPRLEARYVMDIFFFNYLIFRTPSVISLN